MQSNAEIGKQKQPTESRQKLEIDSEGPKSDSLGVRQVHRRPGPIVANLWSDPDSLMLIFAASSAEFAVNPIAEWLFYTGRLPSDPAGRFLSTITYMRQLMLAPSHDDYVDACRRIRGVHTKLEKERGQLIPDESYLDVLLMGMQHSLTALEVMRGKAVTSEEAAEVTRSYRSMAHYMGVPGYPRNYAAFRELRMQRLNSYQFNEYTAKLFAAYRLALGWLGYWMLRALSPTVVEPRICELAGLRHGLSAKTFELLFPRLRLIGIHRLFMPSSARRMHSAARRIIDSTTG